MIIGQKRTFSLEVEVGMKNLEKVNDTLSYLQNGTSTDWLKEKYGIEIAEALLALNISSEELDKEIDTILETQNTFDDNNLKDKSYGEYVENVYISELLSSDMKEAAKNCYQLISEDMEILYYNANDGINNLEDYLREELEVMLYHNADDGTRDLKNYLREELEIMICHNADDGTKDLKSYLKEELETMLSYNADDGTKDLKIYLTEELKKLQKI